MRDQGQHPVTPGREIEGAVESARIQDQINPDGAPVLHAQVGQGYLSARLHFPEDALGSCTIGLEDTLVQQVGCYGRQLVGF